MILTKYADYSVRVLMYLGTRPGQKIPITEIAAAYKISRNHLMKVSQNLARHGLIIGYRGKGGGITLARPAHSIILGDVLERIEPSLRPPGRNTGPSVHSGDDQFRKALEKGRMAFISMLANYSLADLLQEPGLKKPDADAR